MSAPSSAARACRSFLANSSTSQSLGPELVLEGVLVEVGPAYRAGITDQVQPALERVRERPEAARHSPTVGGHHEADRVSVAGLCLVVGVRDVTADRFIDVALAGAHRDEAVLHMPGGDRHVEPSGLAVSPQQLARVARDEPANGSVGSGDGDGGAAPGCLERTAGKRGGGVPQRLEHCVALQGRKGGQPLRLRSIDPAEAPFDRAKHRCDPLQGLRRRVWQLDILEEVEERLLRPLRRQTEEREQIPDFDRMDLHRRRRQQEQPFGATLQSLE